MKKVTLLFFLFGFISISLVAQETIWLDQNLHQTSQSEAFYYKIGTEKNGEFSYYHKNKKVYRKVFLINGILNGNFSEFYNTGELKEIGRYEKGYREGIWKTYYTSGKMKERGKYNKGEKVGIWKTFFKNI